MISFFLVCSLGILNCNSYAGPLEKLEKFTVYKLPPPNKKLPSEITAPPKIPKSTPLEKLEKFTEQKPQVSEVEELESPSAFFSFEEDVIEIDEIEEKEVVSYRYPIQFTPEALSSAGYIFSSGIHGGYAKIQLYHGQYKFLVGKLKPLPADFLLIKPRLSVGAMFNSQSLNFWIETSSNIKIAKSYGAGFKVIAEGKSFHNVNMEDGLPAVNGYVQAFVYKNFSSDAKKISVYLGYSSQNMPIDLNQGFSEYIKKAKSLITEKEGVILGVYFNPNVLKTLSFSAETNAQDYASLSVYYGIK